MIKNIIFDIGGVYLKGETADFLDKVALLLGVKNEINTGNIVFDEKYNRGLISPDECFRKVFKKYDLSNDKLEKIKEIWTNTWKLDIEMEELAKKLNRRYELAVLSNSDILNSEKYKRKGWYNNFNVVVLSHEIGILKPNQKIYEFILKKLKASPETCIFIDDQSDCLIPAKKLGIKTILFKSVDDLELRLRDLKIIF